MFNELIQPVYCSTLHPTKLVHPYTGCSQKDVPFYTGGIFEDMDLNAAKISLWFQKMAKGTVFMNRAVV